MKKHTVNNSKYPAKLLVQPKYKITRNKTKHKPLATIDSIKKKTEQ